MVLFKGSGVKGPYIGENVVVHGYAHVIGDVRLEGEVRLLKGARVQDHAVVAGRAWIGMFSCVRDHAVVSDRAWIDMFACVMTRAHVSDEARVLEGARVGGYARVYGNAQVVGRQTYVGGKMRVGGTAKILGGDWFGDFEVLEGVWHDPEDWGSNVLL